MSAPVTIETISQKFQNVWRSERLVYNPLQDSEEAKAFVYDELVQEPVGSGLARATILKPMSRAASDEHVKKYLHDSVLCVIICLPAEPSGDKDKPAKDTMIGFIKLNNDGPFPRSVSIGIRITPKYQNSGYGREAINWALDWSFRWGDMHRVSIGTVAFNDRAAALYRKLGFVDEGVTRKAAYFDLQWHDLINFGMLEDEWKALRGIN